MAGGFESSDSIFTEKIAGWKNNFAQQIRTRPASWKASSLSGVSYQSSMSVVFAQRRDYSPNVILLSLGHVFDRWDEDSLHDSGEAHLLANLNEGRVLESLFLSHSGTLLYR